MIICFDLDDTLYPEIDFVYSGLYAVSSYLSSEVFKDSQTQALYKRLKEIFLTQGRGKVFNTLLAEEGIYSVKLVKKCLSVYRRHLPDIQLSPSVELLLLSLSKTYGGLYLVTDGNLLVQRNKIKALGLNKYFAQCIPTHQYGKKYAKPSLHAFERIRHKEGVSFNDLVYIGDNPNKDFVSLNKVGALTIRINQGMFMNAIVDQGYEAKHIVNSLEEILKILKDA